VSCLALSCPPARGFTICALFASVVVLSFFRAMFCFRFVVVLCFVSAFLKATTLQMENVICAGK
jgi:hypothetical protein